MDYVSLLLDDIIVFSETFEDHLIRLRLVLKCLQEAGLKLNSKKCLLPQEVKILGHHVSSNGVRPDPDKIKASLLKSGVEFHWGPEEVEAFNSLKKAPFTSDPVLGMYDERVQKSILMQAVRYRSCPRRIFDPDGKLWLPVIPKHLRADILRHFHDAPTAGHLGFAKTYDRIRKRFYWPGCTEMSFAARAEESRQLARVHTLRAQDKDRRYDSKHKWYPTLRRDLVEVDLYSSEKVGLSENS
ncbi:transposon Ty3-I Gag-Pol polyprotein [Trichonephila clavipes]|nr:transposon Ty3-I Gag-Pol polyprotein [Trichonephila clavipes]